MRNLQLTLDSPQANLALDEALLLAAEAEELSGGVLRIWESPDYAVVLGRSSDPVLEVRQAACRRDAIPILRRVSGGATVLIGPGCLMYAIVLQADRGDGATSVDRVHQQVLGRLAAALNSVGAGVMRAGTSDLAVSTGEPAVLRKVSGNSLRIKKRHVLYHGTLLYDFDLPCISRWLNAPVRQPDYRASRPHEAFVANLPLSRRQATDALITAWRAGEPLADWPRERTHVIVNQMKARQ